MTIGYMRECLEGRILWVDDGGGPTKPRECISMMFHVVRQMAMHRRVSRWPCATALSMQDLIRRHDVGSACEFFSKNIY
jgi:hypothetical protein